MRKWNIATSVFRVAVAGNLVERARARDADFALDVLADQSSVGWPFKKGPARLEGDDVGTVDRGPDCGGDSI
jgi:hypothetical protein